MKLKDAEAIIEGVLFAAGDSVDIERISDILDIDVKGGINVKKIYGDSALSIFIMPPSVEVLRQRLLSRDTDSIEAIEERVGKAEYEISFAPEFDCKIINDVLETAIKETEQTIKNFVL
jgi:guanylate kinase